MHETGTGGFLRRAMSILLLAPAFALGAGGEAPAQAPADPVLKEATEANARKDWVRSATILREALARNASSADYHNLYAYALRKGPNPDMDLVLRHYREALRLDPSHRDAHEYIGEAYLMVGDLAKARAHLAELDRLCFFGCEQHRDLKKAVAAWELAHRQ